MKQNQLPLPLIPQENEDQAKFEEIKLPNISKLVETNDGLVDCCAICHSRGCECPERCRLPFGQTKP